MSPENKRQDKNSEELKAVVMPEHEEMEQKLREAKLLGTTPQTDKFFRRFIELVAGSSKVGPGLNLAWELAANDTLNAYPSMIKAVVDMDFDRAVDAVTPDPEVAIQAKEFRKKILEELRQKTEKDKQPAVEDPSSNFELYIATRKIADIALEVARNVKTKENDLSVEDRRREGVNPYYNQTETGLFLDFSYGAPHRIWTPWGEWGFVGGVGSSGNVLRRWTEGVLGRLDTELFRPEINNEQGSFGPTYAVLKVEGTQLPEPKIRPRNAYLPYEAADKAWEDFTKQYEELKETHPRGVLGIYLE